jgi:hypothetical protein
MVEAGDLGVVHDVLGDIQHCRGEGSRDMGKPIGRQFLLTIKDAGGTTIPLFVRLRRLLKVTLRGYRFKCVRAVELGDAGDSAEPIRLAEAPTTGENP